MTRADFHSLLEARARRAGIAVDSPLAERLAIYYQLLRHWNRRMNLTALALDPLSNEALDRLFVEPLLAASDLPEPPSASWFDLGSGGGSPAIPLLLSRPGLRLTMVEVRERKAAFLREVVRALDLDASVEVSRFQQIAVRHVAEAGLVTARAVKVDRELSTAAAELLTESGLFALFSSVAPETGPEFQGEYSRRLFSEGTTQLFVSRRVPRGTNGR